MSHLRNQIDDLSMEERFELLDKLWESIDADALPLTDGQRAELDRRLALYEQNRSVAIPWEQVRERLLNKP